MAVIHGGKRIGKEVLAVDDYRVIELISGRKIAVKRGFFVFMTPNSDEDRHDLSRDIDDGLVIINLNAVAVIREPEEHEKEWVHNFTF